MPSTYQSTDLNGVCWNIEITWQKYPYAKQRGTEETMFREFKLAPCAKAPVLPHPEKHFLVKVDKILKFLNASGIPDFSQATTEEVMKLYPSVPEVTKAPPHKPNFLRKK